MATRLPKVGYLVGGVIALALLVLLAYRIHERLQEPEVAVEKPLPVNAVMLERQPFRVYIESVGTVTAERRIMISAQLGATILEVPNREGARVEKGELLVRLDDSEARRELERQEAVTGRAIAELDYWRNEYEADKSLFEKGMLERRRMDDSRRRVDMLAATVKEAEANLELARLRLGWARVSAPYTGYVQSNLVLEGEQVLPGSPMVELVAAEPLKIVVPVAESDLSELKTGQPAFVKVAAVDRTFDTSVHRIYPALDTRSRNATAELLLPLDGGGVRPGMAAEVKFFTQLTPSSLVVPRHAVRHRGDDTGVFIADDDVASWRSVETGSAQDGLIVIKKGVAAGEWVIVTPHPGLDEGRKVTVAGTEPDSNQESDR